METKSARTRRTIVEAALLLFRRKGFERTTMRDIAGAAGMSLGAAYYYFPSKEALVHAYYEWTQAEHELAAAKSGVGLDLEGRLSAVYREKLRLLSRDRRFLGALFRYVAEPGHPLSVFGEATRSIRDRSQAIFAGALEGSGLSAPLRTAVARALWLAHLGLILAALHDPTAGMTRALRLCDATAALAARTIALLEHPAAAAAIEPFLGDVASAFRAPRTPVTRRKGRASR